MSKTRGSRVLDVSDKITELLSEMDVKPADGNAALLYTLVLSMQISRPELSPEEVANFLYQQILTLAHTIKKELDK